MTMNRWQSIAITPLVPLSTAVIWAQLPEGSGKDASVAVCGNCHDVDVVSGYHLDGRTRGDAKIGSVAQPEKYGGYMVEASAPTFQIDHA